MVLSTVWLAACNAGTTDPTEPQTSETQGTEKPSETQPPKEDDKTPHTCTPAEAVSEKLVDSTCAVEGSYDEVVYCSVCEKELSRTAKTIAKKPHVFDKKVATSDYLKTAADCSAAAVYYFSCQCGAKGSEVFSEGTPVAHSFATDWTADATHHWHVASCQHTEEISGYEEHDFEDGKCTVCEAEETVGVTRIVISNSKLSIAVGRAHLLSANVYPADATDRTIVWTSSDPEVVSVENGRIVSHKTGTAVITATAGGKSATCVVTVCPCEDTRTVIENKIDATCGRDGQYYEAVYCNDCGALVSRTKRVIPMPEGHEPGEPVQENVVESTYFKTGSYTAVTSCGICGEELSRTQEVMPVKASYKKTLSYMPEDTYSDIVELYENYGSGNSHNYSYSVAPFALNDIESFKNTRVTAISIPVRKTAGVDANGNFRFTISVYKNDLDSIKSSQPVAVHHLLINAAQYGLTPNTDNIYKFITVDLTDYNIVIEPDEMMGFGLNGDTLYPAYYSGDNTNKNSAVLNLLKKEFPQMIGFSMKLGSQAWSPDGQSGDVGNSLLFNFTLERAYANKAAYDATVEAEEEFEMMLDTVADAYAGKKLSVFGDSISTYVGISNNTAYNTTISGNAIWYSSIGRGGIYDHTYTYWGSLIRRAGMNLCVNNAWSGDSLGSGKYVNRVVNLHNNTGANPVDPDLILAYFGINDIGSGAGRNVGELLTLLENKGSKTEREVIDEWFAGVRAKAGDSYTVSATPDFDQLYALMLYRMTERYPNAKVACMTLVEALGYPNTTKWVPLYNQVIRALADYFGLLVIEQGNVISTDNYMTYMHDNRILHPNAAGHELIFEEVVRTLYADLAAQDDFEPTVIEKDEEIILGGRTEQDGSFVYSETFIDRDDFSTLEALWAGYNISGLEYYMGGAPYAFNDYTWLSGSRLTSVTIPVMATKNVDANGDYVFTISTFKAIHSQMAASEPTNVYKIKVSALEHELYPNRSGLKKFITIDLTDMNIVVGEDELVAFSDVNDTLVPMYLNDRYGSRSDSRHHAWMFLGANAPQGLGFSMNTGAQGWSPSYGNTLVFNLTYERTYESVAAYDAAVETDAEFETMLDAVADVYGDKKLSVFGDSITTYKGISNNPEYNNTLSSNVAYYWPELALYNDAQDGKSSGPIYSSDFTYWGRMLNGLGMDLCVNNSYGGDNLGTGRFLTRAQNLHNNTGANPDLIVAYFGINDTWGNRACYKLNTLVASRGNKTVEQAVEPFVKDIIEKYENGGITVNNAGSYHFDELYALMLYLMIKNYPNADIICVGLTEYNGSNAASTVPQYNKSIAALAEYFGLPMVDQRSVINTSNYMGYMFDSTVIHPNAHGFEVLYKQIIRTLYHELTNDESDDAYVGTTSFMPEGTFNEITDIFENTKTPLTVYAMGVSPFAYRSSQLFEGHKITSISIPVMNVKNISNGNYVFTLRKMSARSKDATVIAEYKILINAARHGLPATNTNGIYKMIDVDLTDYNIVINAGEVLGIADVNDTLIPGYAASGNPTYLKLIQSEFPAGDGFSGDLGESGFVAFDGNIALVFDFTLEKVYENRAAYEGSTPYVAEEQLVSDSAYNAVKSSFEVTGGSLYQAGVSPFGYKDRTLMRGGKLTSITIPVVKTGAAVNGYYVLTAQTFVADSAATGGYRKTAEYKINVSAAEHGLADDTAYKKMITVDIRDLDIYINNNELIAFFIGGDTIVPAWFAGNATRTAIANNCPHVLGFYGAYGKSNLITNEDAIFFNFTYERVYANKAAYEDTLG